MTAYSTGSINTVSRWQSSPGNGTPPPSSSSPLGSCSSSGSRKRSSPTSWSEEERHYRATSTGRAVTAASSPSLPPAAVRHHSPKPMKSPFVDRVDLWDLDDSASGGSDRSSTNFSGRRSRCSVDSRLADERLERTSGVVAVSILTAAPCKLVRRSVRASSSSSTTEGPRVLINASSMSWRNNHHHHQDDVSRSSLQSASWKWHSGRASNAISSSSCSRNSGDAGGVSGRQHHRRTLMATMPPLIESDGRPRTAAEVARTRAVDDESNNAGREGGSVVRLNIADDGGVRLRLFVRGVGLHQYRRFNGQSSTAGDSGNTSSSHVGATDQDSDCGADDDNKHPISLSDVSR